ncbi:MAG TPA: CBS domain-containing protein [Burkholderiales bacterium]|nr:CBS domain-containing protein [Burkholderiales bacterium]
MSQRTVQQIIEGQDPVTASPGISVSEAARLMKQHNIGAIMAVEDEKLVGVFTERDALFRVLAEGLNGDATKLGSVMTRNPQTISPSAGFTTALQMMHDGRYRHLPVVDQGRVIGVVSVRDALGPELEAFVYEMLREEQIQEVLA